MHVDLVFLGKWTGIVTDARLTHASPANAYANCPDRAWEADVDQPEDVRANCKDIAKQLIEDNAFIRVSIHQVPLTRLNVNPNLFV